MNNLYDIIEDCKINKKVDNTDLKYSVIALEQVTLMAIRLLDELYKKEQNVFNKMKIETIHDTYRSLLNKPPKEWLGWSNDPENPEYQRFHRMANKLADKFLGDDKE